MTKIPNWIMEKRNWMLPGDKPPDFKQIVDKTIAVFAVFTGATLTFFVRDFLLKARPLPEGFLNFSFCERAAIVAAVVSLLLRYIVGSAVHFYAAYVPKTELVRAPAGPAQANNREAFIVQDRKGSYSTSLAWLLFDIAALVVFGILAVKIALSENMQELLWSALYFVAGGFIWSVFVALARKGKEGEVAKRWASIDGVQACLLAALMFFGASASYQAFGLAAVAVVCLCFDFAVQSRPAEVWEAEVKRSSS